MTKRNEEVVRHVGVSLVDLVEEDDAARCVFPDTTRNALASPGVIKKLPRFLRPKRPKQRSRHNVGPLIACGVVSALTGGAPCRSTTPTRPEGARGIPRGGSASVFILRATPVNF